MKISKLSLKSIQKKKGQVWIETVLYTLVGLSLIGIILGLAKPKIDSYRDRAVIEQTLESLNLIDEKITSVMRAPDNRRIVDLKISKGEFEVLTKEDVIIWTMESKHQYSEPGQEVRFGNIKILTEGAGPWKVSMKMNYTDMVNLTSKDSTDSQNLRLESSPTPYAISVESYGSTAGTIPNVRVYMVK